MIKNLLFICFLAISSAFAQDLYVTSQEQDEIPDVFLFSKSGNVTGITNYVGYIDIKGFQSKDTIYFQHPGYELYHICKSDITSNTIQLTRKTYQIIDVLSNQSSSFREEITGIASQAEVISSKEIENANTQSTADLLQESGVFVQKSQMGGGSPILRGFEANKILLVVDNIRLNNAIFRSGHLQNSTMIDPFLLKRSEVIFGPGASIYGSDAIGGVIHFYSRKPILSKDNKIFTKTRIQNQYSSANQEVSFHVDHNIANKKFGSLTSYSELNFNDLIAGRHTNTNYPNYGTLDYHYQNAQGEDQTIANQNLYKQVGTGYSLKHFNQKFKYQIAKKRSVDFNLQHSFTSDVPRFDRLNDLDINNDVKYARWHYTPQQRTLAAIEYNSYYKHKHFDYYNINVAYQNIKEGRSIRRYNSDTESNRIDEVDIFSLNLDFNKNSKNRAHEFYYGLELLDNHVKSSGILTNINTSLISGTSTRYPDGGSRMSTGGIYFVWNRTLSDRINIQGSIRENYTILNTNFNNQAYFPLPFNSINMNTNALSGGLALLYNSRHLKFKLNASSAFRTPNIDDVAKVFDSEPGTVIVPYEHLKAEKAYNLELNSNYYINDKLLIGWTNYATLIDDLIEKAPFTFNGSDSILYDGVTSQVLAQQNTGQGLVYGSSFNFKSIINPIIAINSSVNYTKGINLIDQSPLAHIPPIYGKLAIICTHQKHQFSLWSIFNGKKHLEDYSDDSSDRLNEATVDGTPSWYTINTKWIYKHSDRIQFNAAIENILDKSYKPFSSGPFAPGRNFIVAVKMKL